jgi:hypothetical protein
VDDYAKWFQMIVASCFAIVTGFVFILRPAATVTTVFWMIAFGLTLLVGIIILHQSRKVHVLSEDGGAVISDPDAIEPLREQNALHSPSSEMLIASSLRTDSLTADGLTADSLPAESSTADNLTAAEVARDDAPPINLDDMQRQLQSMLQNIQNHREFIRSASEQAAVRPTVELASFLGKRQFDRFSDQSGTGSAG